MSIALIRSADNGVKEHSRVITNWRTCRFIITLLFKQILPLRIRRIQTSPMRQAIGIILDAWDEVGDIDLEALLAEMPATISTLD